MQDKDWFWTKNLYQSIRPKLTYRGEQTMYPIRNSYEKATPEIEPNVTAAEGKLTATSATGATEKKVTGNRREQKN